MKFYDKFSYYEVKGVLSIGTLLLVYGVVFLRAIQHYSKDSAVQDVSSFWASQFVFLLIGLLVVYFGLLGIFHGLNRKLTGESKPKITDERDKQIELQAIYGSFYTLALGVFVAILLGFWTETQTPTFVVIMFGFLVSGLAADIIRIILYRKMS